MESHIFLGLYMFMWQNQKIIDVLNYKYNIILIFHRGRGAKKIFTFEKYIKSKRKKNGNFQFIGERQVSSMSPPSKFAIVCLSHLLNNLRKYKLPFSFFFSFIMSLINYSLVYF